MKRMAGCGAVLVVAMLVLVASWDARVAAQSKDAKAAAQTVAATAPPAAAKLQQQFLDLSAKKAQLLKEEQLKEAISELESEVEQLTAWSKAEEAAHILQEVVNKHPETDAGRAARAALELLQQQHDHPTLQRKIERHFDTQNPLEERTKRFERNPPNFDRREERREERKESPSRPPDPISPTG